MQRIMLAILMLGLIFGGIGLRSPHAHAQESGLRRLDTGDDGRGWEAVGRLELPGHGFCTGALIAPDLVLTAAHCLFDSATGARLDLEKIEFLAGWRNGRALAYRLLRRAVVHPGYAKDGAVAAERVRNDVALLELRHPILNARVAPFDTAPSPHIGARVGIVSYAHGRPDAPALQEACAVMAEQEGVLVMSCDVDYGSSGAPVFSFEGGVPRIVSVVSAMADVEGQKVSLGAQLELRLEVLRAELLRGPRGDIGPGPDIGEVGDLRDIGAKFARP